MQFGRETVEYVANLSRIALTQEEIALFGTQLQSIVDFIDQLKEADISQVEPTSHPLQLQDVMREDVSGASLPLTEVLKNAPMHDANSFIVPKVIE